MPLISRLFLKSGLIFFVAALITGLGLQFQSASIPVLFPLFWHMLMLGWITQIIMGVSHWMFPGREREESFKNQRCLWIAFISLNVGLLLRVIAEPFINTSSSLVWKVLLAISAVAQFIAVLSYAIEIWPRVKGKKKRISTSKSDV